MTALAIALTILASTPGAWHAYRLVDTRPLTSPAWAAERRLDRTRSPKYVGRHRKPRRVEVIGR